MNEYYKREPVDRVLEYYERELERKDSIIERLSFFEEEEEYLSDDEKKVEGERLRNQLMEKYKCDFEKAVKKINYSDELEFNDFYFAMFYYYEIRDGLIPEEAFKNASRKQIQNILFYSISDFGDSIAKFGSRVRGLKKDHITQITERQYNLISKYLTERQKKFFSRNKPKQSSYGKDSLSIEYF